MPKDTAGSAVWPIGKLVQAVQDHSATNVRIEIPRFQRRLVWNDKQREDLIDSIHRGFPIGSILLYKRPNPVGSEELYQVVDGLQRTSTLVGYASEPLALAPSNLVPQAAMEAAAALLKIDATHVQRAVVDWMRVTKQLTFRAGFRPDGLARTLRESLDRPIDGDDTALVDLLSDALDALKSNVDINAVSLPVVTYAGPEGELPEIFERINQSGTKLNKYEVFAATWLNTGTQVNSEQVRVAINDKYSTLIGRGFSINGLESDGAIQDFNLFEYLFGFGKTLIRDHTLLFDARADPAETEPAAFSLCCAVRGQQLSRMSELPNFMPRSADGLIDPSVMESSLRTAASAVQGWLAPYIGLKLNASGDSQDIGHGELQIVSMIARAVAGRWESRSDWSERPGWEADWEQLRQAMPQHYLMDLIEETWRGPIYSTLFTRIWEVSEDNKVTGVAGHYARQIDHKTWENVLEAWFNKQLDREQRSRPYIRAVDRVFLRFVYTGLVSHLDNRRQQFELEHLFPVSRLKNEIPADGPGWPISCISNLALFTKALNREKSAQTISEYLSRNALPAKELAALKTLLLCAPDEVRIPEEGLTKEEYVSFLRHRWSAMRRALYDGLEVARPVHA